MEGFFSSYCLEGEGAPCIIWLAVLGQGPSCVRGEPRKSLSGNGIGKTVPGAEERRKAAARRSPRKRGTRAVAFFENLIMVGSAGAVRLCALSGARVESDDVVMSLAFVIFLVTFLRESSEHQQDSIFFKTKGLILAQSERWRRGLGMQVERESHLRVASRAAQG